MRALYAAHAPAVMRLATARLGDAAAAEDVVQEVFLRAWRAADRFDARRGSARTWLLAITRNLVIDTLRERRRRAETAVDDDLISERTGARVDLIDRAEQLGTLRDALDRLSPDHRLAIARVVIGGEDLQSAADALGIPIGTLKSRLFYGLRGLRLALEELGAEP